MDWPRRILNNITDGFGGGEYTSLPKKKHLHNVQFVNMVATRNMVEMLDIMFTSADFKGIDPEEDDPWSLPSRRPIAW